jgi:hypothetical protein
VNAETILNATIGVLQQRGRCYGTYMEVSGKVCVLGAMALAAGRDEPDDWELLDEDESGDAELLAAGRALATVVRGDIVADDFNAEDLVCVIGDWHDGPRVGDGDQVSYPSPPPHSAVFALVAEAARLAEQAGASA